MGKSPATKLSRNGPGLVKKDANSKLGLLKSPYGNYW